MTGVYARRSIVLTLRSRQVLDSIVRCRVNKMVVMQTMMFKVRHTTLPVPLFSVMCVERCRITSIRWTR